MNPVAALEMNRGGLGQEGEDEGAARSQQSKWGRGTGDRQLSFPHPGRRVGRGCRKLLSYPVGRAAVDIRVTFGFLAGWAAGQFGILQGCKIHPLVSSHHYISGEFFTNRCIGHKLVIRVNSCQSGRGPPDTHSCGCGPRALGSSLLFWAIRPFCHPVRVCMVRCWSSPFGNAGK